MASVFYPEGAYLGQITDQAIGETKTGKPQFILRVKVLGVPYDDGSYESSAQQYERTIYMVLTDKTVPFVTEKLRAIGFAGTRITDLSPDSDTFQSLKGGQIRLWCKHEADQQGQMRERWDISKGASVLEVKPLDSKGRRSLDSLFAKALQATPAPKSPKPEDENQDKSHYNDPNIDDSDLPEGAFDDDSIPF